VTERVPGKTLYERSAEQHAIRGAIERAAAGSGAVIALLGPWGTGKTELLGLAADAAADAGIAVLRAAGAPLEREFAHAVAERMLGISDASGSDALDAALAAAIGGRPALLALDDAHAVDEASLSWLAGVAARAASSPIVIAVASRSRSADPAAPLATILALPAAEVFRLAPLSEAAVASMATDRLGETPSPGFVEACARLCAGNPLLLDRLLAEAAARGTSAAGGDEIADLRPASAARAVHGHLAALGADARALGFALALLGGEAEAQDAGAAAELGGRRLEAAVETLRSAAVIGAEEPLSFSQPIVASLLAEGAGPVERSTAHLDAARHLDEHGGSADAIARHLLAVVPAGDPWIVGRLRAGASAALARGNPGEAVAFLRRALSEPPGIADRDAIEIAIHELVPASGEDAPQPAAATHPLSEREIKVASLAAAGLSNREIAEQLAINRKTIEAHLSSAYRKLGIAGRTELASALAHED
jgi:DNA-binding NarL/FixJ family response regulator